MPPSARPLPKPYHPSVEEIVDNIAANMAIEGFQLTPAEVELVRVKVTEELPRHPRPAA